jgi:hypothetical protein
MDTLTLTTPSNYVVTLKKALSYRHKLDVQESLLGNNSIKLDAVNPDTKKMDMEVAIKDLFAYRRKAMEYLVVSVTNPDGSQADNAFEAILDMPEDDGEAVAAKVAEVTDRAKKSQTSS